LTPAREIYQPHFTAANQPRDHRPERPRVVALIDAPIVMRRRCY
jgi:hypothetical protein